MQRASASANTEKAAPLIVTAVLGDADFRWADGLRKLHYPAARNILPAHISLFRHLPPSLEPELKDELRKLARGGRPQARVEGIMLMEQGVAIALKSADLVAIWEHLAERFTGLLMPLDQVEPRFHITVQNKVMPQVARATRDELEAIVTPRPLVITGLACWRYMGGPWAPVGSFGFRG